MRQYNPNVDISSVVRAYEHCKKAHSAQTRNSGEPFYIHPLEVAYILAEMELDTESVIAGLLHDVIEDTSVNYDDLKQEFGENVAALVEGVTKLEKIKYTSKEEQQVENLRKMFFAMAKDIRVILIKLADRLHNMRTMRSMTAEKQREKSRETLEVYAPLAHRLGISKIKCELEDLSLRYLDNVAFYEIAEGLNQKKSEREEYVNLIRDTLSDRMQALGINAAIEGRAKHIYSIYRKMYTQGKTLDEIYDLFAVRVIVDTVADCYTTLGMVHEQYKPIPGRFKDYIAMPKPNMYQSLHTTLIGPSGQPFEVQIRTHEMHHVAESGVAAHWKYKEGLNSSEAADEKLAWVREMLDIQSEVTDSEEFMQTLKIDLFADEVFVFTPRGDVVSLPQGATPVDFAFYIHSAVGYRMMGAKANSRIVPLDYKLQNGDIVEILTTSAVHGPSKDWLKIVKTSQARNKINSWFKKENREANIARGKESIDHELKRIGYTASDLITPHSTEQMLRRYGFNSLDDMYSAVGYGGITAAKVVMRLREQYLQAHNAPEAANAHVAQRRVKKGSGNIEVEGIDNCLIRLSRCCTPVPGDKIIGFITRGRGVSIHRADCINIAPEKLTPEMQQRMIRCSWIETEQSTAYTGELRIDCANRNGILADITAAIAASNVTLVACNARTNKDRAAAITARVEVESKQQLEELAKKIHHVPGVFEIKRI
ncbi:MAG: bifunctional (p)ppGpp synthetase/guanosine-3',5'-bis(diphosphate) 3'-pyrophosphohydrolase [Clostridia bacterium]|nr:bifunctional (p)ppGpp synthetase/guanosine-3',5'-bis(diphosphate) 3'-pyrophosphohydrolase [Clostridia bacterium]